MGFLDNIVSGFLGEGGQFSNIPDPRTAPQQQTQQFMEQAFTPFLGAGVTPSRIAAITPAGLPGSSLRFKKLPPRLASRAGMEVMGEPSFQQFLPEFQPKTIGDFMRDIILGLEGGVNLGKRLGGATRPAGVAEPVKRIQNREAVTRRFKEGFRPRR